MHTYTCTHSMHLTCRCTNAFRDACGRAPDPPPPPSPMTHTHTQTDTHSNVLPPTHNTVSIFYTSLPETLSINSCQEHQTGRGIFLTTRKGRKEGTQSQAAMLRTSSTELCPRRQRLLSAAPGELMMKTLTWSLVSLASSTF
ncbi:unnamed protein product [Gadus morhua 'NCC']